MSNERYELEAGGVSPVDRSTTKLLYVSSAKYGGDWHSMLHTHACTELFYVVGGAGQFRIGELALPVGQDDLIIVNPHVEHTEVSLNQSPLEYIVLGVEGLELSAGGEGNGSYWHVGLSNERDEVLPYLRGLLREIESKPPGYEVVCQDLLEVLLVRVMRRTECSFALSPQNCRVSKECALVRRYLDTHFKENISLDSLAELAHVNKYYLGHAFTREYGIPPISYLIARRIQESRYLLSDTDHSLSQISHMLGFSSPSYFSQSFRRLEGSSPMEYRRRQRAGRAQRNAVPAGGPKSVRSGGQ